MKPSPYIETLASDPATTIQVTFNFYPGSPGTRLDPPDPEEIELVSIRAWPTGQLAAGAHGVDITGILDFLGPEAEAHLVAWCFERVALASEEDARAHFAEPPFDD